MEEILNRWRREIKMEEWKRRREMNGTEIERGDFNDAEREIKRKERRRRRKKKEIITGRKLDREKNIKNNGGRGRKKHITTESGKEIDEWNKNGIYWNHTEIERKKERREGEMRDMKTEM